VSTTAGRPRRGDSVGVVALLLAVALACWIAAVYRMRGMDGGPGTALGGLVWYLGVWVTMMAAMMLPSVAPTVVVFHRIARDRRRTGAAPTSVFVAGYLTSWAAYGAAAYGLYRIVHGLDPSFLHWRREGPYVAGAAVALAGIYEATPLKRACLAHCRSPLHFVVSRFRSGIAGGLSLGIEHGLWCVGCCWGLMVVLFALGVMSILWMVVVAALIFAEKMLPRVEGATRVLAAVLVAVGVWIAVSPASVPGLTQPAEMRPMTPGGS